MDPLDILEILLFLQEPFSHMEILSGLYQLAHVSDETSNGEQVCHHVTTPRRKSLKVNENTILYLISACFITCEQI